MVRVERLDHLGVIAAVIKDVGIIDMLDARLVPDSQEEITPGEAVAGVSVAWYPRTPSRLRPSGARANLL